MATLQKALRDPLEGHDPPVGNHCCIIQFCLVMSATLGGQAVPVPKRNAILCRLLSVIRCCRYLKENLWLVAVACPFAHSRSHALAAATTKEVAGIEMYL